MTDHIRRPEGINITPGVLSWHVYGSQVWWEECGTLLAGQTLTINLELGGPTTEINRKE